MAEEENEIWTPLEERLQKLASIRDNQKIEIEELVLQIKTGEYALQQAEEKIKSLNAKYSDLLTAQVAAFEEGDVKSARTRLLNLVREVEKCIALLNG